MIPIKLNELIAQCHTFLLDASGVIYTDFEPIEGAVSCIKKMQAKGRVFVVTNNAFQDPTTISKHLEMMGITIPTTHIISSGHGLEHDATLNRLIKNRNVYVFGSETSHHYVKAASCMSIVNTLDHADCIVLTSSFKDHSEHLLNPIKDFLKTRPHIPIICCNPDRYVMTKHGLKPVIGYFAEKLELELNNPFFWIGKPYENFSFVVQKMLEVQNISLSRTCCFFDDNLHNVAQLKNDLGILGCWVKDTGISKNSHQIPNSKQIDMIIPSLSL